MAKSADYIFDDQIGYVLRRVMQRHLAIFSELIPTIATTQFAVLARLQELGSQSQNLLGRTAAMEAATTKGVVDRLVCQGPIETAPDPDDRRRLTVDLTPAGALLFHTTLSAALTVSDQTLSPLFPTEQTLFMALLARLT